MGHVRPAQGKYRAGIPKCYPHKTARDISKSDDFIQACKVVNANPSIRQARNYRRRLGKFLHYTPSQKSSASEKLID